MNKIIRKSIQNHFSGSGFTLIELAIVIAIIGILASIAVPKFLNLTSTAQTATTNAIAGSLASASASNYAARSISTTLGSAVTNCTGVAALLQTGSLPASYTITTSAITSGATIVCTLTGPGSATATFQATGIN